MRLQTRLVALSGVAVLALAACSNGGGGGGGDDTTITVAYQKTAQFVQLDDLLQKAKSEYEAANEGMSGDLVAIEAEQDQYFTKLALMNGSADTAPDVIYEDTFQIRSDAAAGYLLPIDEYASLMHRLGAVRINVQEKIYPHLLGEAAELMEWVKGTALVPYLERLDDDVRADFLIRYQERITAAFPQRPVFYPFRRILLVADKPPAQPPSGGA